MSEMLIAIFLACSTSGITYSEKVCRELNKAAILKFFKYQTQFNLTTDMKTSSQIMPIKVFFMMMASSMTSQGGLQFGSLNSFITTCFMITKNRAKIPSLNFLCISIMRLWLHLDKDIFMTSLMTSPDHKVSQILKLISVHQYLRYSVDQKLKMSEILMAIFFGVFNFRYNFW